MKILTVEKLIVCAIVLILYNGYGFAAYNDSILEFSDNFNSPDGDVSENVDYSERQAGEWAVADEIIDNPTAIITSNRVRITRGSGFHPDHTLNDIENNLNVSCDAYVVDFDGTYNLFGMELKGSDHAYNWWYQNTPDRPVFQIDGANQWNRGSYRNYEWNAYYDTEYNHINTLFSARDGSAFWTACFCNGEPITAGQGNHGTILRIANPFPDSANMKLVCWAGKTSTDVAADNLVIKSVSPTFDISDWSDDSSSLISFAKTYTHAINCGGNTTTVNGVTFAGISNPSLTSNVTWRILNNVNEPSMISGTQSTTISGNGAMLAEDYFTAAPCSTLILSDLATGLVYKLTLYCNADAPDNDIAVATSDEDGGITTLNAHGSNGGKIISIGYIASAKGKFSITFDSNDTTTSNSWRLYAFSNEMAVPECSLFIGFLMMTGLFVRQ
ncbi:MAG: hypothetical protein DRI44_04310 [Chlamydiae bacterium]|nr:MAG: hypothetical protein DRI44_04310 [Chlamydiota bacterium]